MTIRFDCPLCGKQLKIADKYAGRSGTCPNCGAKTQVPETSVVPAVAPEIVPTIEEDFPEEPAQVSIIWNENKEQAQSEHSDAPLVKPMAHIDHEDLIDMTAMVDIVFFLLIFFLVTSFQSLSSSLPMPAPQSNNAPPQANTEEEEGDSITVRIEKDDSIWVEELRIEGEIELAHKLRDLHDSVAHPDKVQILASGEASHGASVLVMDSAKDAGLDKFSMTIDDEGAAN